MHDRKQNTTVFIIGYAIAILNTMPIWLVELIDKTGGTSTMMGLIASLVLTAAAIGCLIGQRFWSSKAAVLCGGIVFLGLLGSSLAAAFSAAVLIAGAALVGVASGVVLSAALSSDADSTHMVRIFGHGMSLGCLASLVVLASVAITGVPPLPILAVLAGVQLILVLKPLSRGVPHAYSPAVLWRDLFLFPFFLMMGAYWAFLEVFAREQGFETLSGWLAASLVFSALGSFVAGVAPERRRNMLRLFGLGLTAVSGGLTYLAFSEVTLGLMIQCNAFGLFLFVPLYLNGTDAPVFGMARYLFGFALGGGAGGLIIVVGGYAALAVLIVAAGLVAIPALLRADLSARVS